MSYDVSIIICVYNHEKWIERCVRSILNQNHRTNKNFEAIIVNDASTDASLEIINKFNNEPNITIIDNKKKPWITCLYQSGYQTLNRKIYC